MFEGIILLYLDIILHGAVSDCIVLVTISAYFFLILINTLSLSVCGFGLHSKVFFMMTLVFFFPP